MGVEHERELSFELHPVPPFRLELTAWALRRRARNTLDRWDGTYRRALVVDGVPVAIEVGQHGSVTAPSLTVRATSELALSATHLEEVRDSVASLLGLNIDLEPFYGLAESDPHMCLLKDRFLGMKPPRFPTVFEALANAVANQQLSLEVGIEVLNRLTERYGLTAPCRGALIHAFPEPEAIAGASIEDFRELGFSRSKARYLIGLADAIASGGLDTEALEHTSSEAASETLQGLYGIGRWSAEYALLRGLRRLEVFPGDDVGARNKLQEFFGLPTPPSYAEIHGMLGPWAPYGGIVYFHLLLQGLADRGALSDARPTERPPGQSPGVYNSAND